MAEKKKGLGFIPAVFLIFVFFLLLRGCEEPSDTPSTEDADTPVVEKTEEPEEKEPTTDVPQYTVEQQREDFLEWKEQFLSTAETFDKVMEQVERVIQLLAEGRTNVYAAYEPIAKAHEFYDNWWWKVDRAVGSPPKSLSDEHQSDLSDALSYLGTAMYNRYTALGKLLEYLDSPSPARLHAVRSELEDVQPFITAAALKLSKVESELDAVD